MKLANGSSAVVAGGTILEACDLVFAFGETPATASLRAGQ